MTLCETLSTEIENSAILGGGAGRPRNFAQGIMVFQPPLALYLVSQLVDVDTALYGIDANYI